MYYTSCHKSSQHLLVQREGTVLLKWFKLFEKTEKAMNFWKTNEFQKVNGELINSVIDTVTGDSDVDDKVMLVTNFFGHLRCCQKLSWLRSQYKETVMNIWNLSPKHFVSSIDLSPIKILKRIYIFSDKDLFLCFEFCSTSYLGTHTTEQRRDYTKQIFDFYNENFPGISIYKGKNFVEA